MSCVSANTTQWLLSCFKDVLTMLLEKKTIIVIKKIIFLPVVKQKKMNSKPLIQSQMKHHLLRTTGVKKKCNLEIFFWCSSEVTHVVMLFAYAMTDQACFSILLNMFLFCVVFRSRATQNQECPSPGTTATVVKKITWRWRRVRSAAQTSRPSWWRCISTWKRGKLPLRGYRTWASNRVSTASSLPPP